MKVIKEDKILDLELKRREEIENLILDITERTSLSWKQKMVLINSTTGIELSEIQKKEQNERN